MAAMDDPETLGRARLSFANEADIDEFVDMLAQFERGEIAPDQWRAFRLLRGTYGQRQTDDAQMMRVKIPQGILDARAARRAGRRRRAVLARLRPHHDAAEHPVPLRQAARRRAGDARPRRRRPDDARGVRQLGAQHHRLPVRRRVGRRGVRRHAVRRGDDALLPAPSAELVAAAQVQDRLRGLRRGSRRRGDQRHRLARARPDGDGAPRLPRDGRRRHGDDDASRRRPVRVPAGRGHARRAPRPSCACSTSSATTSTSSATG